MSPSEKVRARLELLDERLARLRAERERLVARTSHVERKRETRRKIVIGGTVMAAVEGGGSRLSVRERSWCGGWMLTLSVLRIVESLSCRRKAAG